MQFESCEVFVTQGIKDYKVYVCRIGDFFQARVIDPPSPNWSEVGIGRDEREAVDSLMLKISNSPQAA